MTVEATGLPQPTSWPEVVTRALELGDWISVRSPDRSTRPSPAAGAPNAAVLLVILQVVAAAMQHNAAGEVGPAQRRLQDAAAMLPRPMRRPAPDGGSVRAVLTMQPHQSDTGYWVWRISRVVWREQQELLGLRARMIDVSPRDALIEAGIERLCWIELDPWTWSTRPRAAQRRWVDRGRLTLCERATRLRQFGTPATGAVSQSVWQDLGGYPGLHAAALSRLAGRRVAPWRMVGQMSDAVPARLGRVRACEFARQWRADTGNTGN